MNSHSTINAWHKITITMLTNSTLKFSRNRYQVAHRNLSCQKHISVWKFQSIIQSMFLGKSKQMLNAIFRYTFLKLLVPCASSWHIELLFKSKNRLWYPRLKNHLYAITNLKQKRKKEEIKSFTSSSNTEDLSSCLHQHCNHLVIHRGFRFSAFFC